MTPERWEQIKQLFQQARELAPELRTAFLDQRCQGDPDLRSEVMSLLEADQQPDQLIDRPAYAAAADLFQSSEISQANTSEGSPLAGRTIGGYQLISEIGHGGMGEVHLAYDARLGRQIAVKLLPAHYTADAERVRRFQREARAASALNHPNILTIHDLGEDSGFHYIATEYVEGQTLRKLIGGGQITIGAALNIAAQVASALAAAHKAGVIHRDIKPENIMVRSDAYVKVLDFGLAKLRESPRSSASGQPEQLGEQSSGSITEMGVVMGTFKYMSPEQARGQRVDHRTDIFSLGVVLYEMITGRAPFDGETPSDVIASILMVEPQPLAECVFGLPGGIDGIVARALAKKRAERYQSVAELSVDLNQLRQHLDFEAELGRSRQHVPGLAGDKQQGPRTQGNLTSVSPTQRLGILGSRAGEIRRHTVGRSQERAELRAAFESVAMGRGLLLGIAGEPGIGKTTIVEGFLAEMAEAHDTCIIGRGRCSERLAGTEAYLPLLEALDGFLANDAVASLTRQIAPSWYGQVAPTSPDGSFNGQARPELQSASQVRLKREMAAFFQEITRTSSLVLFFDDLHWADASTIDLLAYLASRFESMRTLIIVSYRQSDLIVAKHPFYQLKLDLQGRGLCREVPLGFLSEQEIEKYIELEFPRHRFGPELAALVHAKTEGNPLFVVDLLRNLRDREVIAQQEGYWVLARSLPEVERELPESVRGMIERKIAQLTEQDRQLLIVASVQGYEFDSAVVAEATRLKPAEVEQRLESLERVHAFVRLAEETEFPDGTVTARYQFVHVLYQNMLYGSLRATRRAALSRAVAQALQGHYGTRFEEVANELGVLSEAAREFGQAAECFEIAAQRASQVSAVQEATVLARRGLAALERLPETDQRRDRELSLQLVLGNALMASTGYGSAELNRTYRRARDLCRQLGDTRLPPVLYGLYVHCLMKSGSGQTMEIGQEFLDLARRKQDPAVVVGHRMIGLCLLLMGKFEQARVELEQSASLYEVTKHRHLMWLYGQEPGMNANALLAWVLWWLGYPDSASEKSQESLRLADAVPQAQTRAYASLMAALSYQFQGDLQQSSELTEAGIALATEHGLPFFLQIGRVMRGSIMAERGVAGGIDEMHRGMDAYDFMGGLFRTYFLRLAAEAHQKGGRCDEGLAALAEALTLVEKYEERCWEAELHRVRGELLLTEGAAPSEIEACFQRALHIARRQRAKSWELRAAMSLARLWHNQGKTAEAHQMLGPIYRWFTEGFDTADLKEARALLDKLALKRHLVGREKERTELKAAFTSALAGRGQLLCLAGEPGMGKTTLVEDFLSDLAAEGRCIIARGRCSERLAGTEAYLPLLEALEDLVQRGSNPPAATVMKQIAPTWYAQIVPLGGEDEEATSPVSEVKAASQERMKRELGAFFREISRARPLVLFFDDLHWADVSTIDVLSFLAGKFQGMSLLILVAYRPSDLLLSKHPFLQIKPDLQARGVCRELALDFLDAAEIARYLALEFPGHDFPDEFPNLIHQKTEGSPLFMADLVRYLRDRGVIAQTDGRWGLAQALPDIERELPESVRGMIERKVGQLSEDERRLLAVASVQGYEFDSAVLIQVLGAEACEVEELLEGLEQVHGFVRLIDERDSPGKPLTLLRICSRAVSKRVVRIAETDSQSAAFAHGSRSIGKSAWGIGRRRRKRVGGAV